MLQVKNLTINHTKDNRVLLEDLSFTLNPGDKAAVIGEEGNGKSTLLKLIYDEALVENYISYTGEIIKHRVRLGYLPQELSEREKRLTAYEFMCGAYEVDMGCIYEADGYENASLFFETDITELSQISRQLNVPMEMFYSEQCLGEMSGGEKIKLQLARMLINRPDVLLGL